MKFKVIKQIWEWLEQGYTVSEISKTYYINPDIIDSINELRKTKIDLEVFG